MSTLPPRFLIPRNESNDEPHVNLDSIKTAQWSCNKHPYMVFVPIAPRYEGPLFSQLNWDRYTVPLEHYGGRCSLSSVLRGRWCRLEHNLHSVASTLLENHEIDFFPLPSDYGYLKSHKTKQEAQKSIINSRDAFLPLIAACSFGIFIGLSHFEWDSPKPPWVVRLLETEVSPAYVEYIRTSVVGDFSVPRVGVLIDPFTWNWTHLIRRMADSKVPMWIAWGHRWSVPPHDKPLLQNYCALRSQVQSAASTGLLGGLEPGRMAAPEPPEPQRGSRDLFWALDSNETSDHDTMDQYCDESANFILPPDPNQIPTLPPLDPIFQDNSNQVEVGSFQNVIVSDKLEDIFWDWYGLSIGSHSGPVDDNQWNKTLKVLGSTSTYFPSHLRTSIIAFVNYMTQPGTSLPPPSCDISHPEGHMIISQSNINIIPFILNGKVAYHIVGKSNEPADNNFGWRLIVHSPVVALRCARVRWGPCICCVANKLVIRGIAYNTISPKDHRYLSQNHLPYKLGVRKANFRPNSSDYVEYELMRDTFLREPHARAALLMGGIVWRLAIEVLGPVPATNGPSFHSHGLDAESSYGSVVDDMLSDDEVNLICGVYKILTSGMCFFSLHLPMY